MDHVLAEVVEVDAFGGGVRRQEDAYGRCLAGARLEGVDYGVALFAGEKLDASMRERICLQAEEAGITADMSTAEINTLKFFIS